MTRLDQRIEFDTATGNFHLGRRQHNQVAVAMSAVDIIRHFTEYCPPGSGAEHQVGNGSDIAPDKGLVRCRTVEKVKFESPTFYFKSVSKSDV